MERIQNIEGQTGYLILNTEGDVLFSSGELENDERAASIIMSLIDLSSQIDNLAFSPEEGFKKLSLTYPTHSYVVCLSNRKIHVIKKLIESGNVA